MLFFLCQIYILKDLSRFCLNERLQSNLIFFFSLFSFLTEIENSLGGPREYFRRLSLSLRPSLLLDSFFLPLGQKEFFNEEFPPPSSLVLKLMVNFLNMKIFWGSLFLFHLQQSLASCEKSALVNLKGTGELIIEEVLHEAVAFLFTSNTLFFLQTLRQEMVFSDEERHHVMRSIDSTWCSLVVVKWRDR